MKMYNVENNSNSNLEHVLQVLQHFFPYAQKQLGFHKPVMVSFQSDEENANKLLGRTGYYNPDNFTIGIYVDGRHPKDVLRSLSHELVHHTQNCNGDFASTTDLSQGYAQENGAMRDAELDAYKRGNIIFRDFEDLIKKGTIKVDINFEETGEPKMSLKEWRNNELNTLLLEKWGYRRDDDDSADGDDDSAGKEIEDLEEDSTPGEMGRGKHYQGIGSKERGDEEGNRPSMAKKTGLDEFLGLSAGEKRRKLASRPEFSAGGPQEGDPGLDPPTAQGLERAQTAATLKKHPELGKSKRRRRRASDYAGGSSAGSRNVFTMGEDAGLEEDMPAYRHEDEEEKATLTLDEARDLARRIFEKISKEIQ